jgi:hypothetical protein
MTETDRQISGMQQSTKSHDSKKQAALRFAGLVCTVTLMLASAVQAASGCEAASGSQRVALLELYTSEGCSSCPPADRFLRSLQARGFDSKKVVALAFHVDYWDSLGWRDRFAQPAFSARQRLAANRSGARLVYTPQFLLDGRDLARGWLSPDFASRLAAINGQRASAALRILQRPHADLLEIAVTTDVAAGSLTHLFVVVLESALSSEVRAGENRGRRLDHDNVVRVLIGPLQGTSQTLSVRLAPDWRRTHLTVAAFLQEPAGGKVLQALAAPLCAG